MVRYLALELICSAPVGFSSILRHQGIHSDVKCSCGLSQCLIFFDVVLNVLEVINILRWYKSSRTNKSSRQPTTAMWKTHRTCSKIIPNLQSTLNKPNLSGFQTNMLSFYNKEIKRKFTAALNLAESVKRALFFVASVKKSSPRTKNSVHMQKITSTKITVFLSFNKTLCDDRVIYRF